MINIKKIKTKNLSLYKIFLSVSLLLIPLSFPLQVIYMQPFMALLPYIFLLNALLFVLPIYSLKKINYIFTNIPIYFYLFAIFVVFSQTFQYALGLLSINELLSSVLFLILPMLFYIPFRFFINENNLKFFLLCLAFASFIVSAFYIYDTLTKFLLREITPYARMAFDYSIAQQGIGDIEDINRARISTLSRSHGLLQSHTVSSLWVMVGYFSLMATYGFKKLPLILITSLYFVILLIAMNFSSIVIFLFIIVFIYFEYFKLFLSRITSNNIIFIFFAITVIISLGLLIGFNQDNPLVKYFTNVAILQFGALFGSTGIVIENLSSGDGITFSDMYVENFLNYIQILIQYPFAIIAGTGFSSTMMGYGGDTGIIETISKFGPGIFLVVIVSYLKVIYKSIIRSHYVKNISDKNLYKFIASILIALLIYEYHYSIWAIKNVFPLIFISLGIYDFLYLKNNTQKKI